MENKKPHPAGRAQRIKFSLLAKQLPFVYIEIYLYDSIFLFLATTTIFLVRHHLLIFSFSNLIYTFLLDLYNQSRLLLSLTGTAFFLDFSRNHRHPRHAMV